MLTMLTGTIQLNDHTYLRRVGSFVFKAPKIPDGIVLRGPELDDTLVLSSQKHHHHHHHHKGPIMAISPYLSSLAVAALDAGVTLSSASTPALDGTYPTDSLSLSKYQFVALFVMNENAFPLGQTTWTLMDVNGQPHVFNTTTQFLAALNAFAGYILALYQIIDGVNTTATELPSNTVTIA